MLSYKKDDFDETLEDIMDSVNDILNNAKKGADTDDDLEEEDKK